MDSERATPPLIAGRYRLEGSTRAASAGVWIGHDTQEPRDVAVVEVPEPPGLEGPSLAAWREGVVSAAQQSASFRHPGAVSTLATGELEERPVVVTAAPEGRTLEEVVGREGPLPASRVCALGAELATVLAAAHGAGVVHGAVCPANVLLGPDGARLWQFGLGAAVDDFASLPAGSALSGAAPYAAPDRARGGSAAADVWSLGAVLRFALEGRAHDASTSAEPGTEGPLAGILERLLAAHAVDRPPAAEARDELAAAAARKRERRRFRRRRSQPPDAPSPAPFTSAPDPQRPAPHDGAPVLTWGPDDPASPPVATPKPDPSRNGQPGRTRAVPRVGSPVVVSKELAAQLMGVGSPAALVAPSEAEEEIDDGHRDEEPQGPFRSTFSWPPPKRFSIGASLLILPVAVVLVALLITDGRIGRSRADEATGTPSAEVTDEVRVPEGWVTYTHPEPAFSLAHPPGWNLAHDGEVVRVQDPSSPAFLQLSHGARGEASPIQTWRDLEADLEATTEGYRRVQMEATTFRNFRAAVWEFTFLEDGVEKRAVDLGVVAGDHRFALYFEAPESDWDEHLPKFQDLVRSFHPPS